MLGLATDSVAVGARGRDVGGGSEAVEMIGLHLGTDLRQHWQADAACFDQLRDREVVLAITGEAAAANAGGKAESNR